MRPIIYGLGVLVCFATSAMSADLSPRQANQLCSDAYVLAVEQTLPMSDAELAAQTAEQRAAISTEYFERVATMAKSKDVTEPAQLAQLAARCDAYEVGLITGMNLMRQKMTPVPPASGK